MTLAPSQSAAALSAPLRPFGAFRFLLAVLVMVHHFGIELASPAMAAAIAPRVPGDVAVMAFFVLSGFIIFEAIDAFYAGRPLAFLANRLLRIVPPYVAALVAAVAIHAAILQATGRLYELDGKPLGAAIFAPANLVANLFDIVPGIGFMKLTPAYEFLWLAWTLRVELMFYAIVFVAAGLLARANGREGFAGRAGVAWAAVAALFLALGLLSAFERAPYTLQFAPYFVFGAAFYLWDRGRRGALAMALLCLPLIGVQFWDYNAGFFARHLPRDRAGHYALLAVCIGAFVFLALRRLNRLPRWDRWLGDLSYPIYLNHLTMGVVFQSLGAARGWTTVLLAMAASVAMALLMHALVEARVKRWRDALRGRALG